LAGPAKLDWINNLEAVVDHTGRPLPTNWQFGHVDGSITIWGWP